MECDTFFPFSALTLLVGWHKDHSACKKLGVDLLVVTIWMDRHECQWWWMVVSRWPFLHYLDFADDVCLLAELMELLVLVLEALATEAESLGLEVNWQKTTLQALDNIQDVPLLSQCWSKRLAQWRNLFTWVLSSPRQLTALQTFSDGVHSRVQQCRALTSSSGGRESRCQLSWGSTTPVYCRFSV